MPFEGHIYIFYGLPKDSNSPKKKIIDKYYQKRLAFLYPSDYNGFTNDKHYQLLILIIT